MTDEQEDLRAHLDYVDLANRTLRVVLGMHPGNAKKPWQRQVGLITQSDWEPGETGRWGVKAIVFFYEPKAGEHRLIRWAPHWRAAIELALAAAIEI